MRAHRLGDIRQLAFGVALIALTLPVRAADDSPVVPAAPHQNWTGLYLGGFLGDAWGHSDWTAQGPAATALAGSLDYFKGYNAFTGDGSYFSGLDVGYNYMFPSHLVLGVEGDLSFPNTIAGTQTFSAPSVGQASYEDTVEYFGTLRARVGYSIDNWLLYATGGLAWTEDRFTRAQLVGTPIGSTASPGTTETSLQARIGWVAGAGVEFPVAPKWTADLQYLFTGFGSQTIVFPASGQRFTSDLELQNVRFGLNYQFGDDLPAATGLSAPKSDVWSIHGQTTFVNQYAPPFRSPYIGQNSLIPNQSDETWDVTFYAGLHLWQGAEFWFNPEIDQGFGLSGTFGVAGFPSGESYKVGAVYPYARLPRMFIRQTIDLGGKSETVNSDLNQFSGTRTADRLVITVGKFAAPDIFDANKYAHDPRNDFLNWALIDTGTFDYAADAWAFTYGAALEWYQGPWTSRVGFFDDPIVPNSTELDPTFQQYQLMGEIERRYELNGQPGKVALTGFLTRARLGSYSDAVQLAQATGGTPSVADVRHYTSRSGLSFNAEQQITSEVGFFARAGFVSPDIEQVAFTDMTDTFAAGFAISGKLWGRPDDSVGFAGDLNIFSAQAEAYLNAGGLGALIGDGKLPHPGPEEILEMYYSLPIWSWQTTLDYQLIGNPAYNEDRGPVSVIGTRLHKQF
jgi:high affinity Mn2+ porin